MKSLKISWLKKRVKILTQINYLSVKFGLKKFMEFLHFLFLKKKKKKTLKFPALFYFVL